MAKRVEMKMTEGRKFLLSLIPGRYDMRSNETLPEPPKIAAARKMLAKFDESAGKYNHKMSCAHEKRMEALRSKAREAVYFEPNIDKVKAIIDQVQKFRKGC